MTDEFFRNEICRVGKSLFDRGYVHATAGNISVRIPDDQGGGFLVTPTDACLGFLEPTRIAKLDNDLVQISGDKASKTILLHQRIYHTSDLLTDDIRCIIHTHSRACVSLSLGLTNIDSNLELLPPITPYFVMKVGHVPLIPYFRPGDPKAATHVEEAMISYQKRNTLIRAVMLSRLGPVIWHNSPSAAMATLEELEETASLVNGSKKSIESLNNEQINELRVFFDARW